MAYLEPAMTVHEAAQFLFVSRPRFRKLIERGALKEVLPKRPDGARNCSPDRLVRFSACAADVPPYPGYPNAVADLRRASTHWLRHTFANHG